MPRRSRRFSFLERALKAAGNTATAGVLGDYANFRAGINKANAGTRDPQTYQRVAFGLAPFGNITAAPAPTAAEREKVIITVWSNNYRTSVGLSDGDVGYSNATPELIKNDSNFYPAVLILKGAKQAPVTKQSGILPSKPGYTSYQQKSYSIPFGRHGSLENRQVEYGAFKALETIAVGAGANKAASASYLPEEWNKGVPDVAFAP